MSELPRAILIGESSPGLWGLVPGEAQRGVAKHHTDWKFCRFVGVSSRGGGAGFQAEVVVARRKMACG